MSPLGILPFPTFQLMPEKRSNSPAASVIASLVFSSISIVHHGGSGAAERYT
jgi:hypothetical protein